MSLLGIRRFFSSFHRSCETEVTPRTGLWPAATGHDRLDFYTMSESEEPDRQAELAIPSEFMIREMERAQRMMRYYQPQIRQIEQAQRLFRKNEHLIRHAQQAQRFFQENERLIRQAQEVAQAAELFARIANWPKINIGPALPYPLRLAYAMDGQMRELLSPRPAAHQRSAALNVNVATTATAEVAAAGGLALSPTETRPLLLRAGLLRSSTRAVASWPG
jgi:hypothetical protein